MLFSVSDATEIKAAVEAAEAGTAGELVVVTAPRADDYAFPRSAAALFASSLLCLEVLARIPMLPQWVIIGSVIPIWYTAYLIFGFGPLLRLIVPRRTMTQKAEERALRAFIECGVTETRDRSGVLIYISELEHRVVLLADRGINERVGVNRWQDDVKALTRALAERKALSGLLQLISGIGSTLAEHFPPRPDDENELSDGLRRLDP